MSDSFSGSTSLPHHKLSLTQQPSLFLEVNLEVKYVENGHKHKLLCIFLIKRRRKNITLVLKNACDSDILTVCLCTVFCFSLFYKIMYWHLHHNPSKSPLPAGRCHVSAGTAPSPEPPAGHHNSPPLGCTPSKAAKTISIIQSFLAWNLCLLKITCSCKRCRSFL